MAQNMRGVTRRGCAALSNWRPAGAQDCWGYRLHPLFAVSSCHSHIPMINKSSQNFPHSKLFPRLRS